MNSPASSTLSNPANGFQNPTGSTLSAEELERVELLAKWRWTGFILCFFGIQAVIWTVAIILTHNDPSHAVARDYNQQTLTWEERQARQNASNSLGWSGAFSIAEERDALYKRQIGIRLLDRHSLPIEGAQVTARLFHKARAGDAIELQLKEIEPGIYVSFAKIEREGKWQIISEVKRGEELFLFEETILFYKPKENQE